MLTLGKTLGLACLTISLVGCSGLYGHDEFQRYVQRSDSITLSAGDAKEVNAAAHMIHPWPRAVGDRRILADGDKMARGVQRYRTGTPPSDPLPAIGLGGQPIGGAVGGGGDAAATQRNGP